jgi:hypothetical protein
MRRESKVSCRKSKTTFAVCGLTPSCMILRRFINSCREHFGVSNRYTDPSCFYWYDEVSRRMPFLTATAIFLLCPFSLSYKYHSLECKIPYEVSGVSVSTGPLLFLSLANVFLPRRPATQCR